MVRFHRLDAQEELRYVVEHSSGERVVIFTSGVLEVVVTLVVKHLIGGKVHGSIQESEPR